MMVEQRITFAGLEGSLCRVGAGRPFLFMHGLCGEARQPIELFPDQCGFECIAPESRGHGKSSFGDVNDLSIKQFADDAILLLSKINVVEPIVIGGVSMGAAIALRLAVHYQPMVSGLVLVRPAWVDQPSPRNLAPHRKIACLLANHDAEKAKQLFEVTPLARSIAAESPDNYVTLMSLFVRQPLQQTQALLAAIAKDGPDVTQSQIAALELPTLVIGTERDAVHPMAMADKLGSLIPYASLVRVAAKSDNRNTYVAEVKKSLRYFLKEFV